MAYNPNAEEVIDYFKKQSIYININKVDDNKWEWIISFGKKSVYSGETANGNIGHNLPEFDYIVVNTAHGAIAVIIGVVNENRLKPVVPPFRLFGKANAFQDLAALQRVAAQKQSKQYYGKRITVGEFVGVFLAANDFGRHISGLSRDTEMFAVWSDVVAVAYKYVAVGRSYKKAAVVHILIALAAVVQFAERRRYPYRRIYD